ncbi:AGE family epimerase/isomerase [Nakamurella sp. GG22]
MMIDRQLQPDAAELDRECRRLLEFGRALPHPDGGAAWLDERGRPDLTQGVHTWITARTVHVYAVGALLGFPGADAIADAALDGLTGVLNDDDNGGWFTHVMDGRPTADRKSCYDHVFVVLAGASGTIAGRPGADALLANALEVLDDRFWDGEVDLFVDHWNNDWSRLDPYRGVNANMHGVEAMLAASDATGDPEWRSRALRIADRLINHFARQNRWRIPEHFDASWNPQLEHNRGRPDDRFEPFGATVGHGLEWSRLLLHLKASLGESAPRWLGEAAQQLFARATTDGWAPDGEPGFVYTTDWDGTPVVRDRLHWVLAEGVAAAVALYRETGHERYARLHDQWWEYAREFLLDNEFGSWHHQLDEQNRPTDTVWPGKPDLYHAVQATVIPRLPLAPGMVAALAGDGFAPS